MIRKHAPLLAVLALAACSGNPLNFPDPNPPVPPGDGALPGTPTPTPTGPISRREARNDQGDGYAESFAYDATTDRFSVDNLGFDGDNSYTRGVAVGALGPFRVYESARVFADSVTGAPIGQFQHRALLGVSRSGETEFAVVRTGAYVGYGFGGFTYQRNGAVTLPNTGQATFSGDYAGIRDFKGIGGLEYTRGTMTMDIDFEDFNDGNAVKGAVSNRRIYDIDGADITASYVAALNAKETTTASELPVLRFVVGPGVMDANGEIRGEINSFIAPTGEALKQFENGKYYAVLSGTNPDEVAGIIVVESEDARFDGSVTARETGGFILYRSP
jgi:hypothetical protein